MAVTRHARVGQRDPLGDDLNAVLPYTGKLEDDARQDIVGRGGLKEQRRRGAPRKRQGHRSLLPPPAGLTGDYIARRLELVVEAGADEPPLVPRRRGVPGDHPQASAGDPDEHPPCALRRPRNQPDPRESLRNFLLAEAGLELRQNVVLLLELRERGLGLPELLLDRHPRRLSAPHQAAVNGSLGLERSGPMGAPARAEVFIAPPGPARQPRDAIVAAAKEAPR